MSTNIINNNKELQRRFYLIFYLCLLITDNFDENIHNSVKNVMGDFKICVHISVKVSKDIFFISCVTNNIIKSSL